MLQSTYGQPLSIVGLVRGEESVQRVVCRDDETSSVHKELAGNVEEDQEEVEGAEAENNVDLGDVGLLLKLLQLRVLGQLLVQLGQVELGCRRGQSCPARPRQRAFGGADSCHTPLSWMEPP